jgi:hypothetical protein
MSSAVRFGFFAASLLVTTALVWGGADLAMLFVRWASEHESAANVIRSLAAPALTITGVLIYRRHRRAAI